MEPELEPKINNFGSTTLHFTILSSNLEDAKISFAEPKPVGAGTFGRSWYFLVGGYFLVGAGTFWSEGVLFGRSRSRCEGPAPAPP